MENFGKLIMTRYVRKKFFFFFLAFIELEWKIITKVNFQLKKIFKKRNSFENCKSFDKKKKKTENQGIENMGIKIEAMSEKKIKKVKISMYMA